MNLRKISAVLALLMAGIVSIHPVAAQADAASLKKFLDKAKSRQQVVAPSAPLTQDDVDRLVDAVPALQATLQRMDPPEPDKEQRRSMMSAMMEGRAFSAMGQYFEQLPVIDALNDEAAQLGYKDYASYANRADSVVKVLTAEQWILAARNMTIGDEARPEPIDNLWVYIEDDTVDAEERQKLSLQLDEMLEKLYSSRADAELVYQNIDAIRPVFQPPR